MSDEEKTMMLDPSQHLPPEGGPPPAQQGPPPGRPPVPQPGDPNFHNERTVMMEGLPSFDPEHRPAWAPDPQGGPPQPQQPSFQTPGGETGEEKTMMMAPDMAPPMPGGPAPGPGGSAPAMQPMGGPPQMQPPGQQPMQPMGGGGGGGVPDWAPPVNQPAPRPMGPGGGPGRGYAGGAQAAPGGSGMLVMGAIGAWLFILLEGLGVIGKLQGMGGASEWLIPVMGFGGLFAYLFMSFGFFAAKSRTSGFAIVPGIFAILAVVGALMFALMFLVRFGGPELFMVVGIVTLAAPALMWLLGSIWAFTAGGGIAITTGITGLLGCLCYYTFTTIALFSPRDAQDDIMIVLYFAGLGLLLISSVMLGILFLSLGKRPKRA